MAWPTGPSRRPPTSTGVAMTGTSPTETRLKKELWQGKEELLLKEMQLLGTLYHPCIVQIYGHSLEGSEALLVNEYMNRRSLDYHLYKRDGYEPLPWRARLSIATSVASRLAFLHSKDVTHYDFKTANVLINDAFEAKIANFGLVKVLWDPWEDPLRTMIKRTLGYLDPFYLGDCTISPPPPTTGRSDHQLPLP